MSGADLAERAARAGLRPPTALTVAITGRCKESRRAVHLWNAAGTASVLPSAVRSLRLR